MNCATERSPKESLYVIGLFAVLSIACFNSVAIQASNLPDISRVPSSQVSSELSGLSTPDTGTQARISENYGKLPLSFEINRGQTDEDVKFLARGQGYNLFLTANEAVLALNQTQSSSVASLKQASQPEKENAGTAVVRMTLVGANTQPEIVGEEPLSGKSNYFTGSSADDGHTDVAHYAKVHYRDVYPGIDLVYYGNQQQLEYDLVVAPGVDPKQIRLGFKGVDEISLDDEGNLLLHIAAGVLTERKPVVYQEIKGERKIIDSAYVLQDNQQVSFKIASYDTRQPLVIDPVLVYSTFLGGSGAEQGSDIAVDSNGNAYIVGVTYSIDFPTGGGLDKTCGTDGACNPYNSSGVDFPTGDVFVTKLNAAGSAVVYSTYLGGSNFDGSSSTGIAVDAAGNAYVTGITLSNDFPTTKKAYAKKCDPGRPDFRGSNRGRGKSCSANAFITKLNAAGNALTYSTYLGGSGREGGAFIGTDIAIDNAGNAYVTGFTNSSDFPTTRGAFDRLYAGSGDVFVTKLNAAGSGLVYSTYLGGSRFDFGIAIAVDQSGNAYVTGGTVSDEFPTTPQVFDRTCGPDGNCFGVETFVTKLNASGAALLYSTFLGSSLVSGLALDGAGNAYITGRANDDNFTTTPGAFATECSPDLVFGGCSLDAFVAKLDAAGATLIYSTYLGGNLAENDIGGSVSGGAIAVDSAGNAYVTGITHSTNFPITPDAFDSTRGGGADAFVTKLNAAGTALIYSSYLGGDSLFDAGDGIALDRAGNAYVTGNTSSANFPTTSGAFDTGCGSDGNCNSQSEFDIGTGDAFVTKISGP